VKRKLIIQPSLNQWQAAINPDRMLHTPEPRYEMNPHHIQTIHADAIRAGHMQRAERHRLALPGAPRATVGDRLRAVAVAFRRPELVAAPRRRPATAPRGC
jgi:hypothetical protein